MMEAMASRVHTLRDTQTCIVTTIVMIEIIAVSINTTITIIATTIIAITIAITVCW